MAGDLTLDVGGVTLRVSAAQPNWLPALQERYAAFLTEAPPRWQVRLEHDPALTDTDRPWLRHHGALSVFRVNAYAGWMDMRGRRASVATPSQARAVSALERTLAYICMQVLPREHDSLLLHSVGVNVNGAGHVFFGPSGAGKTTMARLSAGFGELLSDESVILQAGPGGATVLSTPFWGLSTPPEMVQRRRLAVPLRALYALAHTPDFRLERLAPWEAVAALLGTEKVAIERVESADAWLGVAQRILAVAPAYRLSFRPTPEVWPFIMSTLPSA
jgi:hypothetical protein